MTDTKDLQISLIDVDSNPIKQSIFDTGRYNIRDSNDMRIFRPYSSEAVDLKLKVISPESFTGVFDLSKHRTGARHVYELVQFFIFLNPTNDEMSKIHKIEVRFK